MNRLRNSWAPVRVNVIKLVNEINEELVKEEALDKDLL